MIKTIKNIAKEEKKKIGRVSIKKIIDKINIEIKNIIKYASKNADFKGRVIIKPEDIS